MNMRQSWVSHIYVNSNSDPSELQPPQHIVLDSTVLLRLYWHFWFSTKSIILSTLSYQDPSALNELYHFVLQGDPSYSPPSRPFPVQNYWKVSLGKERIHTEILYFCACLVSPLISMSILPLSPSFYLQQPERNQGPDTMGPWIWSTVLCMSDVP